MSKFRAPKEGEAGKGPQVSTPSKESVPLEFPEDDMGPYGPEALRNQVLDIK